MIRAFVSSTYRDLKDHRAYVIDRLARGGIFVDPMEKWTAASDEPKGLSQERVRDCQLCILLVGFRRGHVPEGERRSITQLEYAEALRRALKVLVFMASEEADWPAEPAAMLNADPEMVRWRGELKEHQAVGFFGSRPESIDVDAAVNRWLQERTANPPQGEPDMLGGSARTIDIRAYSNSEGVLVVWRTERAIDGCRGFALHREVLSDAGITQEVVGTRLGFSIDEGARLGSLLPSTTHPVQNFRWIDRGQREVRVQRCPDCGHALESVRACRGAHSERLDRLGVSSVLARTQGVERSSTLRLAGRDSCENAAPIPMRRRCMGCEGRAPVCAPASGEDCVSAYWKSLPPRR